MFTSRKEHLWGEEEEVARCDPRRKAHYRRVISLVCMLLFAKFVTCSLDGRSYFGCVFAKDTFISTTSFLCGTLFVMLTVEPIVDQIL